MKCKNIRCVDEVIHTLGSEYKCPDCNRTGGIKMNDNEIRKAFDNKYDKEDFNLLEDPEFEIQNSFEFFGEGYKSRDKEISELKEIIAIQKEDLENTRIFLQEKNESIKHLKEDLNILRKSLIAVASSGNQYACEICESETFKQICTRCEHEENNKIETLL